jgi:Fe-S cluster assembly protein SufB
MSELLKDTLESSDDIQYDIYLKGLSEENVRAISADLQEPEWMLNLRLESLKKWYEMSYPSWGPDLQGIKEQIESDSLVFYARPKK